ncbi:MAG: metal-dependent hydrolase [Bacillaceae bacterium]|nr:metal-dependent hydrolase [Bacillaceae bacterium]
MGYISGGIFHFLVGASLAYVMFNKDPSIRKRIFILCLGGMAGISPDITKLFGDILGHSIFFAPVFGLLFAFVLRTFLKEDFLFLKAWLVFSLTVLFGHIMIDYIGNGVALFYPFIKGEYSFSIMMSYSYFVMVTLFIGILAGIFYRRGRLFILASIILISLYFGGLSVSKMILEETLKKQYQSDNINLIITFPNGYSEWKFMVRTDKVWVSGHSPILSSEIYIDEEKKVGEQYLIKDFNG